MAQATQFPRRSVLAATAALIAVPALAFAASSRITLTGALKQGGLVLGKTEPGASVMFEGKPIRVSAGQRGGDGRREQTLRDRALRPRVQHAQAFQIPELQPRPRRAVHRTAAISGGGAPRRARRTVQLLRGALP